MIVPSTALLQALASPAFDAAAQWVYANQPAFRPPQ